MKYNLLSSNKAVCQLTALSEYNLLYNLLSSNLGVILVSLQLELTVVGLSQDSEGLQVGVREFRHGVKVFGRQPCDGANFLK